MIYKSSGQTSATKARQVEARLRSELALGHYGILEQKDMPTLAQFIHERIEPKVKEQAIVESEQRRQKRFWWLRSALKPLAAHAIGRLHLDKITTEHIAQYTDARLADGLSIGSVNRELRALRRIIRLAVEWTVVEKSPKVSMAGAEPFRLRVVSESEFAAYVAKATPLLADVATILNDTGMRPDELHSLRWKDINFDSGRYGMLSVCFGKPGKSNAARRTLPMTARVRCILEAHHVSAGSPDPSGWVFPTSNSKSGHITHSTLKKAHSQALKASKVEPFVLYSLRHSFATRIALSPRMDAWTLCKIMGWSSLGVAMRYIHPSEDKVLEAFGQVPQLSETGDKTGDSSPMVVPQQVLESSATPAATAG